MGRQRKGKMDTIQEQIHCMITPVIHEIFETLNLDCQTASQRFTVGYLIKGLIISKITYMVEILKNRLQNDDFSVGDRDAEESLAYVEPIGNA